MHGDWPASECQPCFMHGDWPAPECRPCFMHGDWHSSSQSAQPDAFPLSCTVLQPSADRGYHLPFPPLQPGGPVAEPCKALFIKTMKRGSNINNKSRKNVLSRISSLMQNAPKMQVQEEYALCMWTTACKPDTRRTCPLGCRTFAPLVPLLFKEILTRLHGMALGGAFVQGLRGWVCCAGG